VTAFIALEGGLVKKGYIEDDVVKLYHDEGGSKKRRLAAVLFWGDEVGIAGDGTYRIWQTEYDAKRAKYVVKVVPVVAKRKLRFRDTPVLKVRFVDVGQGDAAIVESPSGQLMLVDGGEGPWIRRYMRVAFAHLLRRGPLDLSAIVVTHGDADHFEGLTRLLEARLGDSFLAQTQRVFHNGLVKAGSDIPEIERLGRTIRADGKTYITDLVDDVRKVPDKRLNVPFLAWKVALKARGRGGLRVRRTQYGDEGLDFLDGVTIEVLGPVVEQVKGKDSLPFLHRPGSSSLSASHTINGHSVVLRLTYGNVRVLLGADLNEESEESLVQRAQADDRSLEAEILKVPHHGSADFSPRIFERIRPVVSVVSSGDESTAKEYIHPRAGLVGALGKYSRSSVERPLVYVTEMVAFFKRLSAAYEMLKKAGEDGSKHREIRNPYEKVAFGIVHVRTDGERVVVATHSGKGDQKESYAFRVDARGEVAFEETSVV
jgi:beta-lactamase superfamily II metal-dependent hydrolase